MNENPTVVDPLASGPQPDEGAETQNPRPTPPPPPSAFAYVPQRPPLRRSRADRVFGGVCGGIGRQYDIDPTLIRILVVVITVFTGGGFLLAYVLGWIFIPDDPPLVPLGATTTAPTGLGSTGPQPGTAQPGEAPASYGEPTYALPPSYAAGGTGTYVDPATGTVYGTPQYYAPVKPREPRSYLGLITISASVVVGGLLALLAVAGVAIPAAAVAAAMLGVVAIGLLVGAFRGRARWLIAPAIVLLLVAQAAVAVPRSVNATWGTGIGDRTWAPTVSNPAPFQLGIGTANVNLTRVPPGPSTVTTKLGVGNVIVTVNPGTTLVLHAKVGAGDVLLPDKPAVNGTSLVVAETLPADTAPAVSTVDLTVEIGLGELEVRRASS